MQLLLALRWHVQHTKQAAVLSVLHLEEHDARSPGFRKKKGTSNTTQAARQAAAKAACHPTCYAGVNIDRSNAEQVLAVLLAVKVSGLHSTRKAGVST
jgi:hypothetical protein